MIDIARYTLSDFGAKDCFHTQTFYFYVAFICAVLIFVYVAHFSSFDIMYKALTMTLRTR